MERRRSRLDGFAEQVASYILGHTRGTVVSLGGLLGQRREHDGIQIAPQLARELLLGRAPRGSRFGRKLDAGRKHLRGNDRSLELRSRATRLDPIRKAAGQQLI